jgi:hypothetical protein
MQRAKWYPGVAGFLQSIAIRGVERLRNRSAIDEVATRPPHRGQEEQARSPVFMPLVRCPIPRGIGLGRQRVRPVEGDGPRDQTRIDA